MPDEQRPVIYSVEGAVALVTLNRPEKRNALNDALVAGLKDALREADADEAVRVVLLTGAGADFCSGADLSALQKISESSITENLADAESLMELFALVRRVRVPVVAAVRGRALAGGSGLATSCDLVLAARSTAYRTGFYSDIRAKSGAAGSGSRDWRARAAIAGCARGRAPASLTL